MRRLNPATWLWKIQPKGCNAKKTTNNNNKGNWTRIIFSCLKHYAIICLNRLRAMNNVRTARVPAKIRTAHFPN
jgi:hypothetical protein